MSSMIERLVGQVPVWMRPTHPVMRAQIQAHNARRVKMTAQILSTIISLLTLLFIGYSSASDGFTRNPLDLPISQMLFNGLLYPVFLVQIVMFGLVIMNTVGLIGNQERQQLWDTLRVTAHGAALTFRTRWSFLIFHRLRRLMLFVIGARVVLIGALLYDLTAFQGEYLRYLIGGSTPNISVFVGVILLATTITASLLLPFTALGFNAALGLLLATFVKQRTYVTLTQVTLISLRLFFATALLLSFSSLGSGSLQITSSFSGNMQTLIAWGFVFVFAAFGDWGISLLYLGFYAEQVWRDVPYGIFIGVGLMAYVLIQTVLTDLILSYAIRRADNAG